MAGISSGVGLFLVGIMSDCLRPWETLVVCISWRLLTLFFAAAVAALPSKRTAGLPEFPMN